MTDKELTPEQAEAVRRLLADVRHDEPMPDVVARHLDDVVAGLAADRAAVAAVAEARDAAVIPFRQRRWPKVLVAAASVCALGLGISQVVDGAGGSGPDSSTNAGDASVDSDDGRVTVAEPEETADGLGANAPGVGGAEGESRERDLAAWKGRRYLNLDNLTTDSLTEVAIELQRADRGELRPLGEQNLSGALFRLRHAIESGAFDDRAFAARPKSTRGAAYDAQLTPPRICGPVYTVVGGEATYVKYHRRLSLVIFHPEVNGTQLVEVYVCSGRTPRRSVERVTLWDGE